MTERSVYRANHETAPSSRPLLALRPGELSSHAGGADASQSSGISSIACVGARRRRNVLRWRVPDYPVRLERLKVWL